MNYLLIWEGNWDTAYNRMINQELCDIIDADDVNEDFVNIQREIKELIDKKEWIASPEELKKKIFETIYKNKNKLPSSEYYKRTLRQNLYSKHKRMDLNPEWWEKELENNIDTCLNHCLNISRYSDNLIKEIVIFEIMRQWYEFKRKNEEALNIYTDKTAWKIIHTLDEDENENTID